MTKQNLTSAEVQKIARLARLKLTDEEVEKFSGQLSDILSYVNQLQEVDTKNIEPIAQITSLKNITSLDEVQQVENQDEIIACAPEVVNNLIKVKNVL